MGVAANSSKALYVFAGRPTEGRVVAGVQEGCTGSDDFIRVFSGDCSDPYKWRRFRVNYYELAGSVHYVPVETMAVTLSVSPQSASEMTVSCATLAGDELASVSVDPASTSVEQLQLQLSEKIDTTRAIE